MRYRIEVRRIQVIDTWVRATDEESALEKVRARAAEPWGLYGSWKTVDMNAEVIEIEQVPGISGSASIDGPMLLSVKDAAAQLGISRGTLYEIIQRGEIEHVRLGRRMLISRDAPCGPSSPRTLEPATRGASDDRADADGSLVQAPAGERGRRSNSGGPRLGSQIS